MKQSHYSGNAGKGTSMPNGHATKSGSRPNGGKTTTQTTAPKSPQKLRG